MTSGIAALIALLFLLLWIRESRKHDNTIAERMAATIRADIMAQRLCEAQTQHSKDLNVLYARLQEEHRRQEKYLGDAARRYEELATKYDAMRRTIRRLKGRPNSSAVEPHRSEF